MRVLLALVAVCLVAVFAEKAPLLNTNDPTAIPDQYLVIFRRNSTLAIRDAHVNKLERRLASGEKIIARYGFGDFFGYAAVLSKETLASELEHPNVRYIAQDQVVTLQESSTRYTSPSWGLPRVSNTGIPSDNTYTAWESGGSGVTAYVIDTGIYIAHSEFGGRASYGANFIPGEQDPDLNGHGTHVAGTIGGSTYGVAKKVSLVAVKVLSSSGSGSWAGVVSGIQWATNDHTNRGKDARSVANMSLGGGKYQAVDDAVVASYKAGLNHVVAAGNSYADACAYSPSNVPEAISVGATDNTDTKAAFSNYGSCVDVFGPGVNILSSWIGSSTATSTISGTSMASPHVAGVVAVFIGHKLASGVLDTPTTKDISNYITANSTANVVKSPGTGSPNLLIFSSWSDDHPKLDEPTFSANV